MFQSYKERLNLIEKDSALLASLATQSRGLEKESLRVDSEQYLLAQSPHPESLGSALCHPQITNDFSESQLELITPVHQNINTCLYDLQKVHQFTYQQLNMQNELLWTASMPCALPSDKPIPIAHFGRSNVAKMKTAYRQGLSHRYQPQMQTISGIHYNFSLSEKFFAQYQRKLNNSQSHTVFKTEQYFQLIRNFHRHVPLFVYLFGASPAFDNSFFSEKPFPLPHLKQFENSFYLPHATSLRMSDIGYTSKAQESLYICYNHLDDYTQSLRAAIKEPFAKYEAIGLTDKNNHYKQLSTSLLQIENEFYGTIRPKRICASGEAPINALNRSGVEYIEVRCVDIDPFKPMGVDEETLLFLDLLLLFCLIDDSPKFNCETFTKTRQNLTSVIHAGRDPFLLIDNPAQPGTSINFRDWSLSVLDKLEPLAGILDKLKASAPYKKALKQQIEKINSDKSTPSAKVLDAIELEGGYNQFITKQSLNWQDYFLQRTLSPVSQQSFIESARNSIAQQKALEAADKLDFSSYLNHYYSQY